LLLNEGKTDYGTGHLHIEPADQVINVVRPMQGQMKGNCIGVKMPNAKIVKVGLQRKICGKVSTGKTIAES
jgi:hypothetical protein